MENKRKKGFPHFLSTLFSVVLSLAGKIVCAQTAVVPAGEGTEESPYQITQLGHLVWMGVTVSESAGKHYRLMNDIDASETAGWGQCDAYGGFEGFSPIGNDWEETCCFCGVFNGDGHVIRGLYMDCPSSGGLFGVVAEEGRIANLGLVYTLLRGVRYLGGVAGLNLGGAISNCWVSGCLSGEDGTGGIVGNCRGGSVSRCYVSGIIDCQSRVGRIGGIVGCLDDLSTVEQCYADALLVSDYRGGIVYSLDPGSSVSNSYWNVDSSATVNSGGGEGRTSDEMRQAATYVGWDFTNVWGIAEGACTPYLKMFPPPFTLNVITQGMGGITVASLKTAYEPGEQVTLTASSSVPGYVFSHWIGGDSNLLTTVTTVKMTGHQTLKAVFVEAADISTIEELQAIGNMAGNFRLAQDIDATATANWNGGAGFAPVGEPFTGIFDGNGHVIRGLAINRPGQSGVGLFQEVGCPGLVRRVGLDGGLVAGDRGVGTLAGSLSGSVLEECRSSCDVRGANTAGGLLGRSVSAERTSRIIRCQSTGSVCVESSDPLGAWCAGGLVGSLNSSIVAECFAAGNVTCANNAGGLIGESEGAGVDDSISKCFASGSVSGRIGVGGLIGYDPGDTLVRSCLASGSAKGENEVGGLVGSGGTYSVWQPDGSWVTGLGGSYAVGELVRANVWEGALAGGPDYHWSPASYWDVETARAPGGSFGFGKPTAQMKRASTYDGWDFTNVWGIAEGVSYPFLRCFGTNLMLHVVAEGPGRVTVSPLKASYAPGEVVTLTAIADASTNMWAKWLGLVEDEDAAVTTVMMDIHKTVTAVFATPREIASIEELQKIGYDPAYPRDAAYRLTQDIDARATTNWNAGAGFLPLAQGDWPGFDGVIDGQGHTVKGLTINRPNETCIGLVGSHGLGGVLRNVGLAECSVTGGNRVGGLVGHNVCGRVSRSYVQGQVAGGGVQGGVAGHNEGVLSKCYASGTVTATNAAGGLVGGQYYGGRICESDAAASVSGGAVAGGLVGLVDAYAYGVVTQSYWDVEASGCATSAGGEGRTTAEMMRQATYAGWDFSTAWGIDESAGYPFLWRFRVTLPPGVGLAGGTDRPAYAVWAAAHTNAWGTADFSGVPMVDFETAWLLDLQPVTGLSTGTGFEVRLFEVGESEIRVSLALTASGAAKHGSVNGWLAVEAKSDLSDSWIVIAAQQAGDDRIAFTDGLAMVTFARPEAYHFFRPVLRPSRGVAATPVYQTAP